MAETSYLCSVDSQEQAIYKLRETLERAVDKQIKTPKDYDYLSALISSKTNQTISASTLKRFFNYYRNSVTPRHSTLDLISCFLGYKNFDAFCEFMNLNKADVPEGNEPESDQPTPSAQVSSTPLQAIDETIQEAESTQTAEHVLIGKKRRRYLLLFLSFVLLLLLSCFAFTFSQTETSQTTDTVILKKGQKFASFDEYLSLFGITASNIQWYQLVPNMEGIVIWGPQYNHSEWHNEGDSALLMPTITEYWTPVQENIDTSAMRHMRNEAYINAVRLREIRITFMRGLTDSTFTFLGVYRMSPEQPDVTQIVYERIADEVDLSNLDYLQRLRQ